MTGVELMFKNTNWKIPKLVKGDIIRFNYWDSDFATFRGYRGVVANIRYLSAKPLHFKAEKMVRGSVLYTISVNGNLYNFYNQRISSVEKIPRK